MAARMGLNLFAPFIVTIRYRFLVNVRDFEMSFVRNFEPNNLAENGKSFIQEIEMLSLKNAMVCIGLLGCTVSTLHARSKHPHARLPPADSTSPLDNFPPNEIPPEVSPESPSEIPSVDPSPLDPTPPIITPGATCYSGNQEIGINNEDVITWSDSTKNGFHSRGHISGTIIEVFHSSSSHKHISVQIGASEEDAVEVIYNESFGRLPQLVPGMTIEACGDYITSTAQTGWTPSSPDRAVIHWVHHSPSINHDSGFVIIDGSLYGNN